MLAPRCIMALSLYISAVRRYGATHPGGRFGGSKASCVRLREFGLCSRTFQKPWFSTSNCAKVD